MISIDYLNLATQFFSLAKYTQVETLPTVSYETKQQYTGSELIKLNNNNFIPKLPEQTIINLFLKNELSYNKYFNLTTCYSKDDSKSEYFNSYDIGLVDLNQYETWNNLHYHFKLMISDICYFIQTIIGDYNMAVDVNIVSSYLHQIMIDNVEIGYCKINYDINGNFHWISGIGLSEPKLSNLIKLNTTNE